MIVNEGGGGKKLPTLTNPAWPMDVASGKQYINQDGEIETGSLYEIKANSQTSFDSFYYDYGDNADFNFKTQYPSDHADMLLRAGANVVASIPKTIFGNATAADVAAGKTFTSAAGVTIQGTGALMEMKMAQISGPFMNTFEIVGSGGLIRKDDQSISVQMPVAVPGGVIFVSILDDNGHAFYSQDHPGFDMTYWVDNVTDTLGYHMSYGAFLAQYNQSNYAINFIRRY